MIDIVGDLVYIGLKDTEEYERTTPELEEFEGENLGNLITNMLAEVKRLRERLIIAESYIPKSNYTACSECAEHSSNNIAWYQYIAQLAQLGIRMEEE